MTVDGARMLRALSRSMPAPEVCTLEDGRVSCEWYRGKHDGAVVTIDAAGRELTYSALMPNGVKWSGRCQSDNRAAMELFAFRFGFRLGAGAE